MSELNRVDQNAQNPLIQQALIADAILDKNEKEMAKKETEEYHDKLGNENRSQQSIMTGIVATKKTI